VTCVRRKHCADIDVRRKPRRLRRYRPRRRSPASAMTSTLCACRVATRTANTVRPLMLDGSSRRACMRHPPPSRRPPASDKPVQSTFEHARRLRRRRLAASPPSAPIVVDKKNCRASMICITILRLIVFLFCMTSWPKMQRQPRLREQRWQDAAREAETARLNGIWTFFQEKTAEANSGSPRSRGVRLFD
jgi:hypothetical protein